MPKTAMHALIWSLERGIYELREQEGKGVHPLLQGDGEQWLVWLAAHTSFSFQGKYGHLNLLKEARKSGGEGYWYAYRRQGKRTVKKYVGRSADLSMAHLEATAQALTSEPPPASQEPARVQNAATQLPAPQVGAQLLAPKLRPPRLHASLVPRTRLFDRLDAGLERKLTLLSAPAGFGKTTLLRQWLAARMASASEERQFPPLAWLSLDAGDNDPVRFWRYVISACQAFQADSASPPSRCCTQRSSHPLSRRPWRRCSQRSSMN